MKVEITKLVRITGKTSRGALVEINGSVGMTAIKIGNKDIMVYTDEVDDIIIALKEFKITLSQQ